MRGKSELKKKIKSKILDELKLVKLSNKLRPIGGRL